MSLIMQESGSYFWHSLKLVTSACWIPAKPPSVTCPVHIFTDRINGCSNGKLLILSLLFVDDVVLLAPVYQKHDLGQFKAK